MNYKTLEMIKSMTCYQIQETTMNKLFIQKMKKIMSIMIKTSKTYKMINLHNIRKTLSKMRLTDDE